MGVDQVPSNWEDVEGWPQRRDLQQECRAHQQPWSARTLEAGVDVVGMEHVRESSGGLSIVKFSGVERSSKIIANQDQAPFADTYRLPEGSGEAPSASSGEHSRHEEQGEGVPRNAGMEVTNTAGEEGGGSGGGGDSSGAAPPLAAPAPAAGAPDQGLRSSTGSATGSAGRVPASAHLAAAKSRVRRRGFQDILCVGFAVVLCLNLGSMTARREGFFAAGVACLPSVNSGIVLRDLGIWVGWRKAVANANPQEFFNLEELSLMGSAMGILTVAGHATDVVVNAMGIALLLHARRKPAEERLSRAVKRVCWMSLAMATWLCGATMTGFLIAVRGPIGSAAVDMFALRYDLTCKKEVSVSIDYAYAMTTLAVLCQVFIGLVAIPNPVRWCPGGSRPRDPPASLSSADPGDAEDLGSGGVMASTRNRGRGLSRLRDSGSRGAVPGRRRSGSAANGDRRSKGRAAAGAQAASMAFDADMLRATICEPV